MYVYKVLDVESSRFPKIFTVEPVDKTLEELINMVNTENGSDLHWQIEYALNSHVACRIHATYWVD